jgi:hypothetical protein
MKSLTPWRPMQTETLQRKMEDMFERLSERSTAPESDPVRSGERKGWTPSIEPGREWQHHRARRFARD